MADPVPSVCIGVDPGVHAGKLISVQTADFVSAYKKITDYKPTQIKRIVIEISRATHVWHADAKKASRRRALAIAEDVGAVRREGELLKALLLEAGYPVFSVSPRGKLNADRFKAVTGYEGRTSQHGRDAGMLIYGL